MQMSNIRIRFLKNCIISLLVFVFFFSSFRYRAIDTALADAPTTCSSLSGWGEFFVLFEQSEYINGLLALHFEINPSDSDGRAFTLNISMANANCTNPEDAYSRAVQIYLPVGATLFSVRFTSLTHFVVWDDTDNVADDCPGCVGDIPAQLSTNTPYYTVFARLSINNGDSNLTSGAYTIAQNAVAPKAHEPVLIIPGLLGTELDLNNSAIWPNLANMITDPTDSFMDSMVMSPGGTPINSSVSVGSPVDSINYAIGTEHIYDQLEQAFTSQGYVLNQDLFVFAYDWRESVVDLQAALSQKIVSIIQHSNGQKINIIAHSYGGLLLKGYLLTNDANANSIDANIDNVVFVGVPYLGTPEAAQALLFGSNLGIPLLNADEIKKLAQDMPSIYQLLPSAEYYNHIAGFYDDVTDTSLKTPLNYEQSKTLLQNLGKNPQMITDAETLHSSIFDNYDFRSRNYNAYNITGCGTFTLKTITKMYDGTSSLLKKIFTGPQYIIAGDSGDGTVLFNSSNYAKVDPQNQFYLAQANHASMLSATNMPQFLYDLVHGSVNVPTNITSDTSNCAVDGKIVTLDSDLDFSVKDLTNNVSVASAAIEQFKIGDQTNLFLPTPHNEIYSVTLTLPQKLSNDTESTKKTTGVGVSDVNNSKSTVTTYNNLTIDDSDQSHIDLNLGATDALTDTNDTGDTASVSPTATIDPDTVDQVTMPHASVKSLNGSIPVNGVLSLQPNDTQLLFAVDDPSNLLDFTYSFDDGQTWNSADQNGNVTVPDGATSLIYYAEAKTGNSEPAKQMTIVWQASTDSQTPTIIVQTPASTVESDPIPATSSTTADPISDISDTTPIVDSPDTTEPINQNNLTDSEPNSLAASPNLDTPDIQTDDDTNSSDDSSVEPTQDTSDDTITSPLEQEKTVSYTNPGSPVTINVNIPKSSPATIYQPEEINPFISENTANEAVQNNQPENLLLEFVQTMNMIVHWCKKLIFS